MKEPLSALALYELEATLLEEIHNDIIGEEITVAIADKYAEKWTREVCDRLETYCDDNKINRPRSIDPKVYIRVKTKGHDLSFIVIDWWKSLYT